MRPGGVLATRMSQFKREGAIPNALLINCISTTAAKHVNLESFVWSSISEMWPDLIFAVNTVLFSFVSSQPNREAVKVRPVE